MLIGYCGVNWSPDSHVGHFLLLSWMSCKGPVGTERGRLQRSKPPGAHTLPGELEVGQYHIISTC